MRLRVYLLCQTVENSILRQQREFSGGCRCIAPAVVQRRRWAVRRTKKSPPAALAPAELVPEAVEPPPGWVNSLQQSNTQCGKFCTSYDQVTHLDSGRCIAPAPNLSCGWLNKIIRPIRPIKPHPETAETRQINAKRIERIFAVFFIFPPLF